MADRTSARVGQLMPVSSPQQLRNVVLIGCSGAGKTTLAESLALAAGAIGKAGRIPDGNTVSDYEDIEHQQQRSVQLAVLPLDWNDVRINLLDPPGHPDFAAELRAGLHAADAAVFVVSATDPVTAPTRALWRECAAVGIPRAIAVAKLDVARSSFDEILTSCHDAFGLGTDTLRPVFVPVHADGKPCGSVDLLTGRRYGEPGDEPEVGAARESLVEAISGLDDTLMERFLAGETLDEEALAEGLRHEIVDCTLHPALAVTDYGVGSAELLDLIAGSFPDPTHRVGDQPAADPDAPLAAQVVRVTGDPYVGRISLIRVFAGTLRPDTHVHVIGPDRTDPTEERITTLTGPFGKQQHPVPEAVAGDLVCVAKVASAHIGDTLADDGSATALATWPKPAALLPIAVEAHSKTDDDKLSQSLTRLLAEDPALRLEQNPQTHQIVLWCTGEAHAEVTLDRLRNRHGVHVDTADYRVALQETFGASASGHGRLVKQSGGHGQYAICDLEVEPLPTGEGFEFVVRVVGGSVPKHFIPSVEKGVRTQLLAGVATGHPLVDVRVTLVDGKAHSVDSSDSAFQTAAALALRDAASHTDIRLLEPVSAVRVILPDDYLGAVLSDLSARRGHVLGTETTEPGLALLRAEVPEIELSRYPVDLRSLTHGTAEFARAHLRYELMPTSVAAQYT
ncbi:elongation factor G-like protein EF-G2 [Rhodococcus sp. NPDC127528]|uniref:elongation factor G-like protein EF-G2 n=1 Tax=unclassified Rhodococcus (in: high G+C Gram-positive bacteria) TaxID=192944 RepID=UPI00363F86D5